MKIEIKKYKTMKMRGFSLVETLISVFIFSLVMVLLAGAFSGFLKNAFATKKTQRSIEGSQYIMNLMAKTMRSSEFDANSFTTSGQVTMFDNSQQKCLMYRFNDDDADNVTAGIANTIQLGSADPIPLGSGIAGCGGFAAIIATLSDTTAGKKYALNPINSSFSKGDVLAVTFNSNMLGIRGLVTMSFVVAGSDKVNPWNNATLMQTSVSLRR